jgi:aldehyde:ferredoxin oxidoreductase
MAMNDEKVKMTYITQKYFSGLDSYSFCQFVWGPSFELFSVKESVELLQAATGWDVTVDEFLTVGERRLNMMRAFNAREGLDAADDKLPPKFLRPLEGTGPTAGVLFDPDEAKHYRDVYYEMAGWDPQTGNPSEEKLASLGLGWIEL